MKGSALTWGLLVILVPIQLWLAHAVVFFPHEFSHSFVAWGMGWKHNPFDLHVPKLTPIVWLLQLGIDQNVDEDAIFAAHRGFDAAIIGAAGPVLGNGLTTLPLSRLLWRWAKNNQRRGWALFAYWCTAASVGNYFDYVPIRTFTTSGDMGSIERGFGWSPWVVLVVLGIPTVAAMVWFFAKVVPESLAWLFPSDWAQRFVVAALTAGAMFGFFGAVGLLEGGPISHRLSGISVYVLLPLAVIGEFLRNVGPRPFDRAKVA
jgi:hypothetical protein